MIPVFTNAGYRCIAPDFIGFGKSDKLVDLSAYTFNFHRNFLIQFIKRLNLKNLIIVCQDWGGVLGLTIPMEPDVGIGVVQGLLIMNTALGTGDRKLTPGFEAWRAYCNSTPDLDVGALLSRSVQSLTKHQAKGYSAPFPSAEYKAGVRTFPNLVPASPDQEGAEISRRARNYFKNEWTGAVFMAVGVADPVLGLPAMKALATVFKGYDEKSLLLLPDVGHFVQESAGELVATKALHYFEKTLFFKHESKL